MVAPQGEKARPLEKNKASGASEGLEPLSTTGSTGAATCSTAADLGSTGSSKGSNYAIFSEKCQNMRFVVENVNIRRFWTNHFGLCAGKFFCWHFYSRRRGRILIMPGLE